MARKFTKFSIVDGWLVYSKTGRIVIADYSIRGTTVYNNKTGRKVGVVGRKNISYSAKNVAYSSMARYGDSPIFRSTSHNELRRVGLINSAGRASIMGNAGRVSRSRAMIYPDISIGDISEQIFPKIENTELFNFPELTFDLSDYKVRNFFNAMGAAVNDGLITEEDAAIYKKMYIQASEEIRNEMWKDLHEAYRQEFGFDY